VLDEGALGPRGGPVDVMAVQLQRLLRLGELPTITIRVLPHTVALANWFVPETAFSIYRFPDPDDPDTVAVETLAADMILADDPTLTRYTRVSEWLRAAALPPDDSLALIAEIVAAHRPPKRPAQRRPNVHRSAQRGVAT
jgi:hypothetical protein